jgi:hypothetical protein
MKKRPSLLRNATHESLDRLRHSLGPTAAQYSDGQLRQVQIELQVLTDILLDLYAEISHYKGAARKSD